MPRTWPEWRLLVSRVLLAGAGLSISYVREWTRCQAETPLFTQKQALEIRELMTDLRIARGELRIAQAQHDLLTTRNCLSLAGARWSSVEWMTRRRASRRPPAT